jgi:hypothetical protein
VSSASNLVASDPNGNEADLFVNDRASGTLLRVPVERELPAGVSYSVSAPVLSDDGSHLLFWAINEDRDGHADLLLRYDIAHDRLRVLVGRASFSEPSDSWPQPARPSADGAMIGFGIPIALLPEDINGDDASDTYLLHAELLGDAVFRDGFE